METKKRNRTILQRAKSVLFGVTTYYAYYSLIAGDQNRTQDEQEEAREKVEEYRKQRNLLRTVLAGHPQIGKDTEREAWREGREMYMQDFPPAPVKVEEEDALDRFYKTIGRLS